MKKMTKEEMIQFDVDGGYINGFEVDADTLEWMRTKDGTLLLTGLDFLGRNRRWICAELSADFYTGINVAIEVLGEAGSLLDAEYVQEFLDAVGICCCKFEDLQARYSLQTDNGRCGDGRIELYIEVNSDGHDEKPRVV